MPPDIPLEIVKWLFQLGVVGFLIGLMVLYATFQGWHFSKLLSGDPEKHRPVFDEAKELIVSEHWGSRYRLFLKKALSKLTYIIGDQYRFPDELPDKPKLRAGDPAVRQLHQRHTLRRVFGVNPFTVESYQFCFTMAILYLLLSFMLGWVMGGFGVLGYLGMTADTSFSYRLPIILVLIIGGLATFFVRGLSSKKRAFVLSLIIFITLILATNKNFSFVFHGALVISLVIAISAAIAGNVAINLVLVIAIVIVMNISLSKFISIPLVIGLYFFLSELYKKAIEKRELAVFWFIYTLFFLTGGLSALYWIKDLNIAMFLLFGLILPLINTPLDWLSLGITLALLQSIRFGRHRFVKALLWGMLDLGLAIVSLLLVSGASVIVVSVANLLATIPFINLHNLFAILDNIQNWRDNIWVYFMLLWTLVPTAVHFALVGGALTLSVSSKRRKAILEDMDSNDLNAKKAWIYVSIMPAFGFALAPSLLISGLYWILHTHGALLGQTLLAWAMLLAELVDPTLGQVSIDHFL